MQKTIDLRKNLPPIPESNTTIKMEPETTSGKSELIIWNGPLGYHNPDKKLVWIVFISFLVVAALFQIFQKNVTTTAFIALVAIMIFVKSRKGPAWGTVEISPLGVKIMDTLYGKKDIKSFWIEYDTNADIKELNLHLKKWHLPYIRIPLTSQNPVQIRSILIKFIPEVEYEQTLTDIVARRLGL